MVGKDGRCMLFVEQPAVGLAADMCTLFAQAAAVHIGIKVFV